MKTPAQNNDSFKSATDSEVKHFNSETVLEVTDFDSVVDSETPTMRPLMNSKRSY